MKTWWMVLLALAVAGCGFKGGPGEPAPAAADAWVPRPEAMRIYPGTRFTSGAGGALLQARVELVDAMGDPVKGAGEFRLELYPAEEGGQPGRRLYAWRVPMLTLEDQRRFFDPITRAYHLRLRLDEATLAQRPTVLVAVFTPIEGDRINAQAVLAPVP